MPELPDIMLYLHALRPRVVGRAIERVRVISPFVLRTADPPISGCEGRTVTAVERLGKRIVLACEGDVFIVIHLMIAGRFRWRRPGGPAPRRTTLAAFDFAGGSLHLTEYATEKRASIHFIRGPEALREHDPGGVNLLDTDLATFRTRLLAENRTLKRALTDPRRFDGIGNAYSDEILHRAHLSPIAQTSKLSEDDIARLFTAGQAVLQEWIDRLIAETGTSFPAKVTAFRPEMAAHGKFGEPCPVCGTRIARIVRATNEINYCPTCQTGGRVLKDRSLSRLLRDDWPGDPHV